MARLEYSVEAAADIDDLAAFSVARFGREAAADYLNGLQAACDQLTTYPERAAVYPRLEPEIRCLIYRRHRIFYRTTGKSVLIVRILHHARDVKRALG